MLDILFIAIGLAFFGSAILYTRACDRLLGASMMLDYLLGAAVTIFVLCYLVYALIRPERF